MKALIKLLIPIASVFSFVFFTGCASIISGHNQEMTFKSIPEDALVTINGKTIGKTPITTQVERKSGVQLITIEKKGYKTETIPLESTVNGWFFGNIIWLDAMFFSSTTDSCSGAAFAYAQNMYSVILTPNDGSMPDVNIEIKNFVISNYKNIIEELTAKPKSYGNFPPQTTPKPYLKALFALMHIPDFEQGPVTVKIRQLADDNKDIVDFANKVSGLAHVF